MQKRKRPAGRGGIPHLPKPVRYPYFLYAVPKSATCSAFIKESRMELLKANQLHRKYGVWGTRHSLWIQISPMAMIGCRGGTAIARKKQLKELKSCFSRRLFMRLERLTIPFLRADGGMQK